MVMSRCTCQLSGELSDSTHPDRTPAPAATALLAARPCSIVLTMSTSTRVPAGLTRFAQRPMASVGVATTLATV